MLWGDPMNGADVRGIPDDRIKTICRSDDGVCKGEFNIGFGKHKSSQSFPSNH
jgi:hypothetical protein